MIKSADSEQISDILQFPIPAISEELQIPIIELVEKILANPDRPDIPALETEIDRLVYALYGLTEDEIAVVVGAL